MGRKKKLWTALAFFLALAVTVGPLVRRLNREAEAAKQLAALEARLGALEDGEKETQRDLAKWYNYQLGRGALELSGAYGYILDFGDGMMGVLEVPELNLRLPIFHGNTGEVGHDPDSSLPIGGRGNHTVLPLAQGYCWTEGQTVYIDCLGERLAYRVESVQVMPMGWSPERPTAAGQDLLTLLYDRGGIRTLIRCIRCTNLTVRETEGAAAAYRAILAAVSPLALLFPALLGRIRSAAGEGGPPILRIFPQKQRKNQSILKLWL